MSWTRIRRPVMRGLPPHTPGVTSSIWNRLRIIGDVPGRDERPLVSAFVLPGITLCGRQEGQAEVSGESTRRFKCDAPFSFDESL